MTKSEIEFYIAKQTAIIQSKQTEDELRRYETLLSGAMAPKEVYETLIAVCDKRRKAINRESALAESGDTYDLLQ